MENADDNPFRSQGRSSLADEPHDSRVTFSRALLIIGVCSALFAGIGAGVGWTLGTFVPGYYRGVSSGGERPGFSATSVGIGLGLTQGLAGGAAIGLGLVGLFLWREISLRRP
jgi:hypothetical protein